MIKPAEAARELQIRRVARDNIVSFSEVIDVPGRPVEDEDLDTDLPVAGVETKLARHHKLMLEACDACAKKETGRLMLFFPPGSAKSTYASVVFPAHYLGANANRKVILASYGDELALKMGKRTRSIVRQGRYKGIFGCSLSQDSQAMNNWTLTNGSEYMACGIRTGVTGNRADVLVIDDPIKGREQAESETIRRTTYEAYQDDLLTRLKPGGSIILMMTRWHESDLAGNILPENWNGESGDILCKDGNVWRIVCVPAQCERADDPLNRKIGEYLWPEWFTQNHWNQYKLNARTWGSLFQQRPTPLDGGLFNPNMIQILEQMPTGSIKWLRGWDLAATEDDGDWTVGLKLGRHTDGRFIIADVRRKQYRSEKRDKLIKDVVEMDGRSVTQDFPEDPGQAGKGQIVNFVKMLAGYVIKWSRETGSKEVRSEAFATQVNIGNVYMMRADWNTTLVNEYRAFPNGTWDDIVDAGSRAFNRLMLVKGKLKVSAKALERVSGGVGVTPDRMAHEDHLAESEAKLLAAPDVKRQKKRYKINAKILGKL